MASRRTRPVAAVLLLLAAAAALLLLLCSTSSSEDGYLGRVDLPWGASVTALPFSPADVLPLLPRGVAMAALRALRGVSDIFPVFVGAASADGPGSAPGSGGVVRWKGACFYENEAWLVFHNESGSRFGGGTVHIKVRRPSRSMLLLKCRGVGKRTTIGEFVHVKTRLFLTSCCYIFVAMRQNARERRRRE